MNLQSLGACPDTIFMCLLPKTVELGYALLCTKNIKIKHLKLFATVWLQ